MLDVRQATNSDLEAVAGWLAQPEIAQWLDFGARGRVDALALKYSVARGAEQLFVFALGQDGAPVGTVALSNIHPRFETAMLWYALGEPRFGGRGLTTRAVAEVLRIGFYDLGLQAINAWTVVGNEASAKILKRNDFRLTGRQRGCHRLGMERRDRLLFDILREEFVYHAAA